MAVCICGASESRGYAPPLRVKQFPTIKALTVLAQKIGFRLVAFGICVIDSVASLCYSKFGTSTRLTFARFSGRRILCSLCCAWAESHGLADRC